MQRASKVTLTPAVAADNNIALSQTPGGAGALVLNGANVSGGIATLDMARRVRITSAANDSARSFIVTGTSRGRRALTEVIAGPNAGTVDTVNDFLTVTSVVVDAATAGAIKVGTGGKLSSQWIPQDQMGAQNLGLAVVQTGVASWTVEHSQDDPYVSGVGVLPSTPMGEPVFTAFPHPTLALQAASKDGSYLFPIRMVRLTINSYTAGASVTMTAVPGMGRGE